MKNTYKIGIIGLGSIGTRHLKNVVTVLKERNKEYMIDLIRSGKSKEIEEEIAKHISHVFYSYESVPNDYDIIFVTNPTNLHFETIRQFVTKTKHMFIEKPVFDITNVSIDTLHLKDDSIYYVACPLRYTNVIQYFKHQIDLNNIYCARSICSSFLPEWRPNKDYRNTYSAHKNQGGGVSIDLIHEWDYICYLFGNPENILNIRGTFSNLRIDSDDLSLYIAKYSDKAVEVHLDYFGRKTIREIQVFTDEDTIVGDIANSEIRYLKSGKVISFKEQRNDFQCKEIEHFFDIIEGKVINDNDILTALRTLQIAKEGK
ncbi:Gfo/Idh/MocA family oxidoreductase [Clostridium peptidivorans]|uniref:Gfo/Idh/MocA family oxidoreductase n=1 Tax=Clostridium peptidivorans TaxID=100174 RepID=UPI000BE225A4|nr:Gfo/Idh/MocA family oxidoreductase [Clostridium peptidivorans]